MFNLKDLFAAIEQGGNTPWAQAMQRQMLGQEQMGDMDILRGSAPARTSFGPNPNSPASTRPVPPTPTRSSAPVSMPNPAPGEKSVVYGSSPETPASESAPQYSGQTSGGVVPPSASAGQGSMPDFSGGNSQIGNILSGVFGNGVIGGLGRAISANSEADDIKANKERFYQFLTKEKGVAPKQAELIVTNKAFAQQMLPSILGPKSAPKVVTIPGQYGMSESFVQGEDGSLTPVQEWIRAQRGGAAASAPAQAPAMPTQGSTQGSATMPPVVANQPAESAAVAPTQAPPAAPQAPAIPQGYAVGAAVPKPPDGYIHEAAPDGSGFLYKPDGSPKFISKEAEKRRAELQSSDEVYKAQVEKAGRQFANGVALLERFPDEFGTEAFERALGPWQVGDIFAEGNAAGGLWGSGVSVGSVGKLLAQGLSEANALATGGASPTEVRDRITASLKSLSIPLKELVRKPGEGVWTDKDQKNLEDSLGALGRSRSKEEYNRRLNDVLKNVEGIFLVDRQSPDQVYQRDENSPPTAEEEVTLFEQLFGGNARDEIRKAQARRGAAGSQMEAFDRAAYEALGIGNVGRALGINPYWEDK